MILVVIFLLGDFSQSRKLRPKIVLLKSVLDQEKFPQIIKIVSKTLKVNNFNLKKPPQSKDKNPHLITTAPPYLVLGSEI